LYCDKFLGDKERSKEYYGENPVNWDEIGLEVRIVVHHVDGSNDKYDKIHTTEIERILIIIIYLK
jgi:hypothetical protein